jgi:hypothetical protein
LTKQISAVTPLAPTAHQTTPAYTNLAVKKNTVNKTGAFHYLFFHESLIITGNILDTRKTFNLELTIIFKYCLYFTNYHKLLVMATIQAGTETDLAKLEKIIDTFTKCSALCSG